MKSKAKKVSTALKPKALVKKAIKPASKKFAGFETATLVTTGATILGAAAVAAAGWMLWKRRDQIMGFVESVEDKFSTRFSKDQHEEQYPYGRDDEYYTASRDTTSRL